VPKRKTITQLIARCLAMSIVMSSVGAGYAESLVSIPEFQNAVGKKHTASEDEEYESSAFPPRPLQLRRANNLLAAGDYKEAITEYSTAQAEWREPRRDLFDAEREWGFACEKLGRNEEALQHYKKARSKELEAKLQLKLNRFKEAKRIADEVIVVCALVEQRNHGYDFEYPEWLRLRAAAEEGLKLNRSAIADLKEASQKYFKNNSAKTELCIREANALTARSQAGGPLTLKQLQLPQLGQEKVTALVKFLVSSPDPFNLSKINELTGGHLKMPGSLWPSYSDDTKPGLPFANLKYYSNKENYQIPESLEIEVSTAKCCLPKVQIDSLLTTDTNKHIPSGQFKSRNRPAYREEFELATGNITFVFGESGARILKEITLRAPLQKEEKDKYDNWKKENNLQENDTAKDNAFHPKSPDLDKQNIALYVMRANSYLELKLFDEALADTKSAVLLGGRPYLNEQSIVEEKMGNLDAAIEHLKIFIGDHKPGPETATYFTRLADLHLQKKDYEAALVACQKAMINTQEKAPAMFMRAKVEKGLNKINEAREDAKIAAKEYFDQARIVRRDEVLEWLKTLPAN